MEQLRLPTHDILAARRWKEMNDSAASKLLHRSMELTIECQKTPINQLHTFWRIQVLWIEFLYSVRCSSPLAGLLFCYICPCWWSLSTLNQALSEDAPIWKKRNDDIIIPPCIVASKSITKVSLGHRLRVQSCGWDEESWSWNFKVTLDSLS